MKSTIDIINETLSNNIFRMRLNDDEYPSEDICERCNGCGETIINNDTVFQLALYKLLANPQELAALTNYQQQPHNEEKPEAPNVNFIQRDESAKD